MRSHARVHNVGKKSQRHNVAGFRGFLISTLVVALLWPMVALAEPELKGSPTELSRYLSSLPKEVVLTGEAKMEVQAESGTVTILVKTDAPLLQQSLQANRNLRNEIIAKLSQSGMARNRIRETKFSSTPEYGMWGKKPSNYLVENVLQIAVENENELLAVAGIVDSYKDVFYQGIELKEEKKEELKERLLKMALTHAAARQRVYEKELGITLKPIGFEEHIAIEKIQPMGRRMEKTKAYESFGSSGDMGGEFSLGKHTYAGSVTIKYAVVPAVVK